MRALTSSPILQELGEGRPNHRDIYLGHDLETLGAVENEREATGRLLVPGHEVDENLDISTGGGFQLFASGQSVFGLHDTMVEIDPSRVDSPERMGQVRGKEHTDGDRLTVGQIVSSG